MSDNRKRNFATLVYVDSAPEFWMDILLDFHVPTLISPLHDKDVWTEYDQSKNPLHVAGTLKKPHYHVVFLFQGKKNDDDVISMFDQIGGVGLEYINSPIGYARYLCHLDEKDKFQYDVNDVRALGVDYFKLIEISTDKYQTVTEMVNFIKENDIYSYAEFLEFCAVHRFDWFKSLCDNSSYVIREYLKSKTWDLKEALANEKL